MAEQIFFALNVETGKPVKTIGELKTQTRLLAKELDNTKIGTKRFNQLKKSVSDNKQQIKGFNREITKTKPLADTIKESVSGIQSQVRLFGVSIGSLTTGFAGASGAVKGAAKSMGILRAAIISTGIGALVVALGSIVVFLTQTQRGIDLVKKASAGLSATMDVLVDRVSLLGEFLIAAFENPQKALKDFGDGIKQFVLNRIEDLLNGLKGLGKAFNLLFAGEFKEAAKTAGSAIVDLVTATNPLFGLIKDNQGIIQEIADEIANEATAAIALQDALTKLEDREISFIKTRALLTKEIEAARIAAKSENATNAERLAQLDKAIELEEKILITEQSLANERARISREQLNLGESTREEIRETIELEAKAIEVETQSLKRRRTIQSERLSLVRKLRREEELAIKAGLKLEQDRVKAQATINEALVAEDEKRILAINKRFDTLIMLAQQFGLETIELEKARQEKLTAILEAEEESRNILRQNNLNAQIQAFGAFFGALADLASENFAVNKAFSIAEAIVNTFAGSVLALTDKTIPNTFVRIAAVGTVLATGFAQIAKITATKPPKAQAGMILDGASHAQGGIGISMANGGRIEAEGGEAIINKRSTAMFGGLLSAVNQAGGGKKFQSGGIAPSFPQVSPSVDNSAAQLANMLGGIQFNNTVSVEEIQRVTNQVDVIEQSGTL